MSVLFVQFLAINKAYEKLFVLFGNDVSGRWLNVDQCEHARFWFRTVRVSFSVSSRPRQVDLKLIYTARQAVNGATQE